MTVKGDKVFGNTISALLGKTQKRSRSTYQRGSHTVFDGFKVNQPPTWSKRYGHEVYVRHVGKTVQGYPELEKYAGIIREAGYDVERCFDVLYITKGGNVK